RASRGVLPAPVAHHQLSLPSTVCSLRAPSDLHYRMNPALPLKHFEAMALWKRLPQTLTNVLDADACATAICGIFGPSARVDDLKAQRAVIGARIDLHPERHRACLHPVLNRVFDQRMDQHTRYAELASLRLDVEADDQLVL